MKEGRQLAVKFLSVNMNCFMFLGWLQSLVFLELQYKNKYPTIEKRLTIRQHFPQAIDKEIKFYKSTKEAFIEKNTQSVACGIKCRKFGYSGSKKLALVNNFGSIQTFSMLKSILTVSNVTVGRDETLRVTVMMMKITMTMRTHLSASRQTGQSTLHSNILYHKIKLGHLV